MGSVYLDNVDDYLAPSQACVNPLFTSGRVPGDNDNITKQGGGGDDRKKAGEGAGGVGTGTGIGIGTGTVNVKPRRTRVARRRKAPPQSQRHVGNGIAAAATDGGEMDVDTSNGGTATTAAAAAAAAAALGLPTTNDGAGPSSSGPAPPPPPPTTTTIVSSVNPSESVPTSSIAVGGGSDVRGRKRAPTAAAPKRQPVSLSYQQSHDDNALHASQQQQQPPQQSSEKKKAATVSVADCLACSGCVTSAEAVLVSSHSVKTLREHCRSNDGNDGNNNSDGVRTNDRNSRAAVVFTVSPASLADLTRHLYHATETATASTSATSESSLSLTAGGGAAAGGGEGGGGNFAISPPPPSDTLGKLATFLRKETGAALIMDGAVPQELSLIEAAEEFCARHRYRASRAERRRRDGGQGRREEANGSSNDDDDEMNEDDVNGGDGVGAPMDCSFPMSTPSIALSATETRYLVQKEEEEETSSGAAQQPDGGATTPAESTTITEGIIVHHDPGRDPRLDNPDLTMMSATGTSSLLSPMLASSCPGFVCYVEKTAPRVVPNLCSAKSPMAIAGAVVKHTSALLMDGVDIGEEGGGKGKRVYHVAIMPCHDKKLEAGRKDLTWEIDAADNGNGEASTSSSSPDVDLVLTTSELLTMIADAAAKEAETFAKLGSSDLLLSPSPSTASSSCAIRPVTTMMTSNNNGEVDSTPDASMATTSSDDISGTQGIAAVRTYFDALPRTPAVNRIGSGLVTDECPVLLSDCSATENNQDRQQSSRLGAGSGVGEKEDSGSTVQMIGSGGYAEYCFRYAARALFGHVIPDEHPLPWKRVTSRGGGLCPEASGRGSGSGSSSKGVPVRRRRRAGARGGGTSAAHSDLCEVALYRRSDGSYSLSPEDQSTVEDSGKGSGRSQQAVLKFAIAYGFKNVQLVLMKLGKRAESNNAAAPTAAGVKEEGQVQEASEYYHFIEVMACPSGCLNGGGQIREDGTGSKKQGGARRETPAETRQRVGQNRSVMESIGLRARVDFMSNPSPLVSKMYGPRQTQTNNNDPDESSKPLFPSGPFGDEAKKLLHTRFHVVPKLELTTGATAGVALDDTKW